MTNSQDKTFFLKKSLMLNYYYVYMYVQSDFVKAFF